MSLIHVETLIPYEAETRGGIQRDSSSAVSDQTPTQEMGDNLDL
jgi:hypothetical protein